MRTITTNNGFIEPQFCLSPKFHAQTLDRISGVCYVPLCQPMEVYFLYPLTGTNRPFRPFTILLVFGRYRSLSPFGKPEGGICHATPPDRDELFEEFGADADRYHQAHPVAAEPGVQRDDEERNRHHQPGRRRPHQRQLAGGQPRRSGQPPHRGS